MIRRDHGERPFDSSERDQLSELAMNMITTTSQLTVFSQEVQIWSARLQPQLDPVTALILATALVTLDLQKNSPERVQEFLGMFTVPSRSIN